MDSQQILDSNFHINSFEARLSGMTNIYLNGKRVGDNISVGITFNNTNFKKTFEAKEDFFLEDSILSIYKGKGLKIGDSYTLMTFNPLTLAKEEVVVAVIGKEGNNLILETRLAGLVSKNWINEDGYVIREETSNGWLMKLENKKEIDKHLAETGVNNAVDLITNVSVPVSKRIEHPRQLNFMKIKVSGIELKDFPFAEERQKLVDQKKGIIEIKTITPEKDEAIPLPYQDQKLNEYLQPSLWIQSDDAKIQAKAREIIKGEKNSWLAAKRINDWLYKNINKSFSIGIPVATSILAEKKGDCNEHTVLFVSLARAVGLPAETCVGLVYMNNGFYYHAWPKVYVGKWMHLDPTFGQSVADATHIELVSGDISSQTKLVQVIGKIKIEVLEKI
ncbi:MAG: transglutaminase-like domain-containing protein [bacterium]